MLGSEESGFLGRVSLGEVQLAWWKLCSCLSLLCEIWDQSVLPKLVQAMESAWHRVVLAKPAAHLAWKAGIVTKIVRPKEEFLIVWAAKAIHPGEHPR